MFLSDRLQAGHLDRAGGSASHTKKSAMEGGVELADIVELSSERF